MVREGEEDGDFPPAGPSAGGLIPTCCSGADRGWRRGPPFEGDRAGGALGGNFGFWSVENITTKQHLCFAAGEKREKKKMRAGHLQNSVEEEEAEILASTSSETSSPSISLVSALRQMERGLIPRDVRLKRANRPWPLLLVRT